MPPGDPFGALTRLEGYEPTDADEADLQRHQAQFTGHILVDREGVVRWANVECAREGLAGFGALPSEEELLVVARAL